VSNNEIRQAYISEILKEFYTGKFDLKTLVTLWIIHRAALTYEVKSVQYEKLQEIFNSILRDQNINNVSRN
jgi:hypothetical protein